jgi:FKBP-type peptidyl-prolyl cis-trans isomerase SlyD
VPKKYFRDPDHLKPGMLTVLSVSGGGQRQVTVQKVGSSVVDVDLNHPLAGKTLTFDVEIVDVRDATPEELAHGHAHGADGHGHEH